jgi:hypothetical protein
LKEISFSLWREVVLISLCAWLRFVNNSNIKSGSEVGLIVIIEAIIREGSP